MFIGNRLKQIREEKNLTQIGLGKQFNTSGSTINRYERGQRQPGVDILIEYANFFNISVDWILERTILRNPLQKIPDISHYYDIQEAEETKKVDPGLFKVLCQSRVLPEFERQKLKEYFSFILSKYQDSSSDKIVQKVSDTNISYEK